MAREERDEFIDKALEADPHLIEVQDRAMAFGTLLTVPELLSASERLYVEQSASDFIRLTKELCGRSPEVEFFNNPKLKRVLHDAYVLAEFVRLSSVDGVWLNSDDWPDGFVRTSGVAEKIEVTSTHGDRKLGEEHRKPLPPTFDPVENWIARADSIPKYLDECICGKIEMNYVDAHTCRLLVYLNIEEYGIRQRETEGVISKLKTHYAKHFQAISVLWKQRLY